MRGKWNLVNGRLTLFIKLMKDLLMRDLIYGGKSGPESWSLDSSKTRDMVLVLVLRC